MLGTPDVQAQGGSYVSSIGEMAALTREISSFRPQKGSDQTPSRQFTGGNGRYRMDILPDHDKLTLIIEREERYTVPGTTPGAPAYRVTDIGSTTLEVDTCPEDNGTIIVSASASGSYEVVGEGLLYRATLETDDTAEALVNEQANVSGRRHALTVRGTASGDRPTFVGGGGAVDSQLDASLTWSGAASTAAAPDVTLNTAEGVDTRDLRSAFTGGAFTAALVDEAIEAASQVWRNGHCLKLNVDPAGQEGGPRLGDADHGDHRAQGLGPGGQAGRHRHSGGYREGRAAR